MATKKEMRCEVCGGSPFNDDNPVTLYRTGEKGPGKDPHWRCEADGGKDKQDPEVLEVTQIIESHGKTKH